jgi:hypothetical protein
MKNQNKKRPMFTVAVLSQRHKNIDVAAQVLDYFYNLG